MGSKKLTGRKQAARDLFEAARAEERERGQPLAARMRPRTLDEFTGQEEILGPGKLLRRAVEADRLFSSIILWGPPGTGKTSLASIIANKTSSHFETLSAVLAGVADIRRIVEEAHERFNLYGQRTILLVDEIHRFNKAQQDALLPHVENGTIILIGATTENPYFEVNSALLSRSRIFQFVPLTKEATSRLLHRALKDPERGYGGRQIDITDDALEHLAELAGGDARSALNALELAVESTPPDADGVIHIDLDVAQESIQRRVLRYDKTADEHYDTISAFIKSMRGSDPDAALYYLAKMLYAGEDPEFIARRMVIFSSEDVGNADPQALVVAVAAAHALQFVGLPEAQLNLAQGVIYLATAPKSNSTLGIGDALSDVERLGNLDIPNYLKDASRDAHGLGHGKGYQYPHNFEQHFVVQQYLPDKVRNKIYYKPGELGYEQEIAERLKLWREQMGKHLNGASNNSE
ncbi:MAG TPA: AAA family ATPase [Anaerolineae bacterium]|nr:AAA family ATPase [Anaerolineae bacterium]